jgi:hypothetical protein
MALALPRPPQKNTLGAVAFLSSGLQLELMTAPSIKKEIKL